MFCFVSFVWAIMTDDVFCSQASRVKSRVTRGSPCVRSSTTWRTCTTPRILCVARAGAVTCSELLACGLPSILIPSPVVAEVSLILVYVSWAIRLTSCFVCLQDHQTYNAKEMADLGAAVEIRDVDLAPKQSTPNTAGQKNDGEPAPRRHVRLEYVIRRAAVRCGGAGGDEGELPGRGASGSRGCHRQRRGVHRASRQAQTKRE